MNEQLEQALVAVINDAVSNAEAAKVFVLSEIPEVWLIECASSLVK